MNRELTKLMYELYDREFDIDKTLEVMEALHDLRRIKKIKNIMTLNYGVDSGRANKWLKEEIASYNHCELIFRTYQLEYNPYEVI